MLEAHDLVLLMRTLLFAAGRAGLVQILQLCEGGACAVQFATFPSYEEHAREQQRPTELTRIKAPRPLLPALPLSRLPRLRDPR